VELLEIDRSEFEKFKSKNLEEVADLRMEAAVEGGIRTVGDGSKRGRQS
jgi:hypothetical protein